MGVKFVKIERPSGDGSLQATVPTSAVAYYEAKGWSLVDGAAQAATPASAPVEGDLGDVDVDGEATHGTDPDETSDGSDGPEENATARVTAADSSDPTTAPRGGRSGRR